MKRIPEKFELTEEDIKDAIRYWLNAEHCETISEFDVVLKVEAQNRPPPAGAPVGGMSDWTVQVVSAVATKS